MHFSLFHALRRSCSVFTLGLEKGSAHFDDSYTQEVSDRVNELDLAQFGWAAADESRGRGYINMPREDIFTCHAK